MKQMIFHLSIVGLVTTSAWGQQISTHVYKSIDTTQLSLTIYTPVDLKPRQMYPAMIFFFGGGWNGGTISQFAPHARHFVSKEIICILADYRVKSRQGTTPFEALKDAKSAIRFIKKNAVQFQIDTQKIIASGGSAGGHLAAATALCESFNESSDDLNVSSKPAALVLFNPVIDNGPGGYGYDRVGEAYKEFSPLHNISEGAPPTLLFLGSEDTLIPVETLQYYKKVMEKVGSRCDLFLYEGQEHGFFNYGKEPYYSQTVEETFRFLKSLNLIPSD